MPQVRPFVGLVYDPSVAGPFDRLTAPPYDIISPVDQERYHRASPYNVIRLILGKEDPGDDAAENKYTRAASFLRSWREEGVLKPTAGPSLFAYEMGFHLHGRRRRVRGAIASVELRRLGDGIIPHERTMPGPVRERARLLRAVRTNLSPVFVVMDGPVPELAAFLDAEASRAPLRETTDELGTVHRLWASTDREALDRVLPTLSRQRLMIADGHHRYAVAFEYREQMRAEAGPGPWDEMMMLLVDGALEPPPVLPIHRLVRDDGHAPFGIEQRVKDLAEVLASVDDDAMVCGVVHRSDGELVHGIASLRGDPPLVCALHGEVLDKLPPERIRFVHDAAAAEAATAAGDADVAYLLPPTTVERVRRVVATGGRLPQKSTYFWPKPRTGMVLRPLDA